MNYYNVQQNALAALEEMRGSVTMSDDPVICPKPRRVGILSDMPLRPLRRHLSKEAEGYDSKAGAELLDIIFKESYGEERQANQVASSPPYFVGSPPVRATNPLIQDSRFGNEKHTSPSTSSSLSSSSSASGGFVRMKLGLNSAAVRVEGFDCHIPAVS